MAYTDKNAYDVYFSDVRRPKTIIRNINGYYFDDTHWSFKSAELIADTLASLYNRSSF